MTFGLAAPGEDASTASRGGTSRATRSHLHPMPTKAAYPPITHAPTMPYRSGPGPNEEKGRHRIASPIPRWTGARNMSAFPRRGTPAQVSAKRTCRLVLWPSNDARQFGWGRSTLRRRGTQGVCMSA